MKSALLEAALECASLGWPVLPVRGKVPAVKGWPEQATTEPNRIEALFRRGVTGLGILAGEASGLMIIDIDPRNGGDQSFHDLVARLGPIPETVSVQTGGGGRHLYFRWREGDYVSKPAPGVDFIHSSRSFVVAPPSEHASGKIYRWINSPAQVELADLPSVWRRYFEGADRVRKEEADVQANVAIPEGQRNNRLFGLGLNLLEAGTNPAILGALLHEHNRDCCQPPLDDEEVITIIDSVLKRASKRASHLTLWQHAVAADGSLKPGVRMVAMGLSFFANAAGKSCFPSQQQIADRVAMDRGTVAKALDALERQGWVERYRKQVDGPGFSYGYILRLKCADVEN